MGLCVLQDGGINNFVFAVHAISKNSDLQTRRWKMDEKQFSLISVFSSNNYLL